MRRDDETESKVLPGGAMGDWGEQPGHASRNLPDEEGDRPGFGYGEQDPGDIYARGKGGDQRQLEHRYREVGDEGRGGLSDEEVRRLVLRALDEAAWIPEGQEIDVRVEDAVVTLRGEVDRRNVKIAAGICAWDAPGVEDVFNELRVSRRLPQ
jgi:hypothetical protein